MALDIIACHDRTSADHQTRYNNTRAAGYSTVSLCIYGVPIIPFYAAAMVKRATQAPEQKAASLNRSWNGINWTGPAMILTAFLNVTAYYEHEAAAQDNRVNSQDLMWTGHGT